MCDSRKQTTRPDLVDASPADLVASLKNDNLFWRRHAQRLLVERGTRDVVPDLLKLISDTSTDEVCLNVGAIHALWTLRGLGAIENGDPQVLGAVVSALRHPSAGVRRNAAQVLPRHEALVDTILDAGLLRDPSAQVRLQALLTLSDLPPSAASGRAVASFLSRSENFGDHWLVDAATCAAATNPIDFLTAATDIKSPPTQLIDACKVIANHLARTNRGPVLERLLTSLESADSKLAGAIVAGLDAGWPPDTVFPSTESVRDTAKRLFMKLNLEDRVPLTRLVLHSGDRGMQEIVSLLADNLKSRLDDEKSPIKDRAAAAELLLSLNPSDASATERLIGLITPQAPQDLSLSMIRALQNSTQPTLGNEILERISFLTPSTRDAAFDLLLSRPTLTHRPFERTRTWNGPNQ